MIYISIDNNYHFEQASKLIHKLDLTRSEFVIIKHNSIRNTNIDETDLEVVRLDGHPLSDGMSFKNIFAYLRVYQKALRIKSILRFAKNDVLIIFTEYQLNNAIYAKEIKKAGGCVYLFDEGIGFYFNNSFLHKNSNPLKHFIFKYIFFLIGLPVVSKNAQEGIVFSIKDCFIDKVFLRMNIPINRNVPVNASPITDFEDKNFDSKRIVIFFAANFDCFKLKKEEMDLASKTITHLLGAFSKVFIKIHPSDYHAKNDVFDFYNSFNDEKLRLIDNSIDAVKAIELFKPEIVVGSMSTVLFDALSKGVEPVFTYHLLPHVKNFQVYTYTLANLGYNFIKSIDEISSEYKSGIDKHNLFGKSSSAIDLMEDFRWQE